MGEISKIQWTDATWNPWHGCKKVSAGCKFCYMFRDKERYNQNPLKVLRSKTNFFAPLKWKDSRLVFTCSWSDWFIAKADEWRDEAWEVIKRTPQHTYQILTKRPERVRECLPSDWGEGYPNVWLGVSIEDYSTLLNRMTDMAQIPAAIKFISFEPLLDLVVPGDYCLEKFYDWIIIGGESGNETGKYRYRPCDVRWIESLILTGKKAGCKVFVKQLGTYLAKELKLNDRHGGDIDEWPQYLRVREMPDF